MFALSSLTLIARPLVTEPQKTPLFPSVKGENLEKKSFTLPRDLQGDINLVILAFQQEQQSEIDGWLPAARDLCSTSPALRYYEVPVIQKTTREAEVFINQGMVRGIPVKDDRERTITLYTDKKRFDKSLDITNEDTIHLFLLDRKEEIVWRGTGEYTPDKAKSFAEATQTWTKTKAPRIETLAGKPTNLNDFRGKTVFLILSAQKPTQAASLLMQEVIVGSAAQKGMIYVTGEDLTGAPGVLRGVIRDGIKDAVKKDKARLVTALKEADITDNAILQPVTLFDWEGGLARQFGVTGKTDRAYQVFVLNREGKIVFRCEQPVGGKKVPSPAPQILKAIQEAK